MGENPGLEVERVLAGMEPRGGSGWSWRLGTREARENTAGLRLWDGQSPSLSALTPQVGITLHYSSLSTLLWMGVKARVLHKELTWRAPPPQEGDAALPAPRPMLRYVLPSVSSAVGRGSGVGGGHQKLFSQGACSPRGPRSWEITLPRQKRWGVPWGSSG